MAANCLLNLRSTFSLNFISQPVQLSLYNKVGGIVDMKIVIVGKLLCSLYNEGDRLTSQILIQKQVYAILDTVRTTFSCYHGLIMSSSFFVIIPNSYLSSN
jgi:hypothetical protein